MKITLELHANGGAEKKLSRVARAQAKCTFASSCVSIIDVQILRSTKANGMAFDE
jgi:hypothetical protein